MVKVYVFIVFILCCGLTNLSAQTAQIHIETNYGSINDNKKVLAEIKKDQRQTKASIDGTNLRLDRIEQRMATTDSIYSSDIAKKDAENQALSKERDSLINDLTVLNNAYAVQSQRIEELERIIQLQKNTKYTALPLGIHQFVNGQTGDGIIFSITQIGLLTSGSIFMNKYLKTRNTYLTEPYQSDVRHSTLRNSYRWQLTGSIASFLGAGASIWLNYLDNFKSIQNKNIVFVPDAKLDIQGKPQMVMNLSIKF